MLDTLFRKLHDHPYFAIGLANLLFACTLFFDFAYDDFAQIINNPQIAGARFDIDSFWRIVSAPTPGMLYRPVTTLSYWTTFLSVGLTPSLFHLQNIILHTLCCCLLYRLVVRISVRKDVGVLSALLFAVHPIHVEAVANIIGRAELLAAFFGLSSMLLLLESDGPNFFKDRRTGLALLLFFLATLSKESSFTILFLLPYIFQNIRTGPAGWYSRTTAIRLLPFLGISAVSLGIRKLVLHSNFFINAPVDQVYWENPIFHLAFPDSLVAALKILGDYLRLLVFPITLSADYSRMPADLVRETYGVDGLISILCVILALSLLYIRSTDRYGWFGFWVVATFGLTANVLTLTGTVMGERLAYLPSVGFIVYSVFLIYQLVPKQSKIVLTALFVAYGIRTALRLPVWINQESVMGQTLVDAPSSPKATYNYGIYLLDDKQNGPAAEEYFRKVLEFYPNHILSLMCLGDIALSRKDYDEMEKLYWRVLELSPNQPSVRKQLNDYRLWRLNNPKPLG